MKRSSLGKAKLAFCKANDKTGKAGKNRAPVLRVAEDVWLCYSSCFQETEGNLKFVKVLGIVIFQAG